MATGIGLLASDLDNASGFSDVVDNIRVLINQIDSHILERNTLGYTSADTRVPQNLTVAGLRPSEAQALIYSEVLEIYAGDPSDATNPGKGFRNVKLVLVPHETGEDWFIHTEWNNMISREERAAKMAIIEKYTERRPFTPRSGAKRPAPRQTSAVRPVSASRAAPTRTNSVNGNSSYEN